MFDAKDISEKHWRLEKYLKGQFQREIINGSFFVSPKQQN